MGIQTDLFAVVEIKVKGKKTIRQIRNLLAIAFIYLSFISTSSTYITSLWLHFVAIKGVILDY